MVRAIWAVACLLVAASFSMMLSAGCSNVKTTVAPQDRAAESPGAIAPGTPEATAPVPPGAAAAQDPALSPVPGSAGSKSSSSDQVYQIGAEDVLHISVWDNRELTLDVTVRPDGKISIPLIRDIPAAGLTANELADVIHKRLLSFIKDPQVAVVVSQVNAPKIYVIGNVVRPGPYPLRSDMSVLQALALAGGFTQFASPRSIKIVRGSGEFQEVRKVNYFSIIDDKGKGNYLMRGGDTLVIP